MLSLHSDCAGIVQICVVFGDIFVRWPVLFVEQNLPFQFQGASAVAFAGQALLRIVQNCSPMQKNCCSDNSVTIPWWSLQLFCPIVRQRLKGWFCGCEDFLLPQRF